MDVSLTSYAGSESPADDESRAEFDRVLEALASPSGGARLFSAEFAGVPDVGRLAEWMVTKWAPAVLRGYAIAGTCIGARPVYATQTGNGTVKIVWQELVDFDPVTSGRMVIDVGERGMTASRGAGDPSAGFGAVSATPLPGEDILVRKLADAASQAMEKGLALKVRARSPRLLLQGAPIAPPVDSRRFCFPLPCYPNLQPKRKKKAKEAVATATMGTQ